PKAGRSFRAACDSGSERAGHARGAPPSRLPADCASGEIRYAVLRGHPLRLGRSSMARPDQSARWVLRAELPEHELAVANLNHVAIDRAELHLLAVQDGGYEHAVSAHRMHPCLSTTCTSR